LVLFARHFSVLEVWFPFLVGRGGVVRQSVVVLHRFSRCLSSPAQLPCCDLTLKRPVHHREHASAFW